ncbi:site-specific DNA-methyltransferase [uncultured Bacteroides sp.]|uniref:DNA-methyltransferase n=1 Tax=uncultured Bacteroides sp. TaxID=162156 RepID=UPI00258FC53A|nr:site-specific DNA-methyltransferase [uncultured Bacteroides sp.]
MNINQIYNEDCQEGIKRLPDASIDCILTDPPYLYLKGQKLDRPFDEQSLFLEFARVLKPTGFIVLFGRGTSFYRWNTLLDKVRIYNGKYGYLYEFNGKRFFNDIEIGIEALKNPLLQFKEEIVWHKGHFSSPVLPIGRIHETISLHTINGKINASKINYIEMKKYNIDEIVMSIKRLRNILSNAKELEKVQSYLSGTYIYGTSKKNKMGTVMTSYKESCPAVNIIKGIEEGVKEQTVIREKLNRTHMIHPTQKPVRLLERLLALTTHSGDVVLDPFAGSCSTAIACVNTNRKFIGFEIDKEYYDAGVKRLNKALSEPKLVM